jgi:teichuronic acid biosynthesis glycosyltransferase TuaG
MKYDREPIVSVIVTSFNRPKLLEETLHSILNQSFQEYELIVIDNYSEYDFFELIRSFGDSRIKAFQNHNDGNIAINRNYGIKQAIGKYLAFCDDDDIWRPNKLSAQVNHMKTNPKTALCYGYAKKVGSNTKFGQKNYGILYFRMASTKNDLRSSNTIVYSSVLCSSRIFKNHLFPIERNFIGVEDYKLWLSSLSKGNYSLITEILVDYRYHDKNTSQKVSPSKSSITRANGVYGSGYNFIRSLIHVSLKMYLSGILTMRIIFGRDKPFSKTIL